MLDMPIIKLGITASCFLEMYLYNPERSHLTMKPCCRTPATRCEQGTVGRGAT